MNQVYYLLYSMMLYIIFILFVYILIYNQIQEEGFTSGKRRSYNSNSIYARNSIYGTYKKGVHRVSKVLKVLRLY